MMTAISSGMNPVWGKEMRVCASTEKAAENRISAKNMENRLVCLTLFRVNSIKVSRTSIINFHRFKFLAM
jgi:hypothetical protein